MEFVIENARIVTPSRILEGASVGVREGIIAEVREGRIRGANRLDARGAYVLPGFVDVHSDAIEKEIEPRPGAFFPLDIVSYELDKKLASCGITTMFHSVTFNDTSARIRSNSVAADIVRKLNDAAPRLKIKSRVHVRYEITDHSAIPILQDLMKNNMVHLLSVMDHTPGQGQFREIMAFKEYYGRVYRKTDQELDVLIERKLSSRDTVVESLQEVIKLSRLYGIPVASHDDDSIEKIQLLKSLGVGISEFPVNIETARAATENGISVCLGAPNIIRGTSQTGNLSAREALVSGYGDILCSDYSPMSLPHAVFALEWLGIRPLIEAVNMVSINPARAAGIAEKSGSIEAGKSADLVVLDVNGGLAKIMKTFVGGREVFSTC